MSASREAPSATPLPRRYRIVHETEYRYAWPADSAWQLAHLRPRPTPRQQLLAHRLRVEPEPAECADDLDYFGNPVQRFAVPMVHERLLVRSDAEVAVQAPARSGPSIAWEEPVLALRRAGPERRWELAQFVQASPFVPLLPAAVALARPLFSPGCELRRALLGLAQRIHEEFRFDPQATHVGTPLAEVLAERRGVCQDFAHLMVGALRGLGLPARYVSGYLLTNPPPGQPRLVGADASHAWVSVWSGEAGWLDVDPTNGRFVDEAFITLAWGRDYGDVAPLRGVVRGGGHQALDVRVTVSPCP
jgi:transglutaminase-like putative cysteine protease